MKFFNCDWGKYQINHLTLVDYKINQDMNTPEPTEPYVQEVHEEKEEEKQEEKFKGEVQDGEEDRQRQDIEAIPSDTVGYEENASPDKDKPEETEPVEVEADNTEQPIEKEEEGHAQHAQVITQNIDELPLEPEEEPDERFNSQIQQNLESFHQLIEDLPAEGETNLDNQDKKTEKSLLDYEYEQIPVEVFGDEEIFANGVNMKKKEQEEENHQFYGMENERDENEVPVVESNQVKDDENHEESPEQTSVVPIVLVTQQEKVQTQVIQTQTENQIIHQETQTTKSLMKIEIVKTTIEEEVQTSGLSSKNEPKKSNPVQKSAQATSRKFPTLFFQPVTEQVPKKADKKEDKTEEKKIQQLMKQDVTPKESILKQEESKTSQKQFISKLIKPIDEIKLYDTKSNKNELRQTTAKLVVVQEPSKQHNEKVEEVQVKKKKKHKNKHKHPKPSQEDEVEPKPQKVIKQDKPIEQVDPQPPKKPVESQVKVVPPRSQSELLPLPLDNPPTLLRPVSQQDLPPLTSQIIATQAYKQRMGSTYSIFNKYVANYTKALTFYKNIVQNVNFEIQKRKNNKTYLLNILTEYFQGYAKANREFNQKLHSLQNIELPASNNPFGNIKLELKPGCQELINVRRSVGNEFIKISNFTINTIMKNINTAFSVYFQQIGLEQQRHQERKVQHAAREKTFYKVISQVQKVFRKGMEGKFKIDIFSELARFVNEQITHRGFLKIYGKGVLPLRKTYISAQKELFESLQYILNHFKTESKVIYSVGRRFYDWIEDLSQNIKAISKFEEISPLTDIDYIRYVLQIQQKKEHRVFKTHHFESYLDLIYWDRLVGNIRDVYKGAICKIFPMSLPHEELVHTISGNLVHFNIQTDQVLNTFIIKNINARIIGEGTLQFDELLNGIIFDDSRTVRIKLKDSDRAEELICYLDEKDSDFIVEERPLSAR